MDMITGRHFWSVKDVCTYRHLIVELYKYHRTMEAVIEDTMVSHLCHPGKSGIFSKYAYCFARMTVFLSFQTIESLCKIQVVNLRWTTSSRLTYANHKDHWIEWSLWFYIDIASDRK
jgi:hypothetical protein